eukprot:symbB.v1.2.028823.t1/scaffold3092.1/size63782/3
MSLLDILPLGQIQDALMLHLTQLPASPSLSPLAPFVKQTLQLSQVILLGAVEAMLATAQITQEILRLVCFMMEKGLNAKEEEQEGDGEGGQTEFAAGTGMGQGEGLRDVTDEIEDDAQLEGTRNEKEEEQPEPEQKKPEEDNAREVGFDLDTEAKAMPQSEEDKQQDQDKEEDEEQDLDRQQGEVDLSKGGTLDEKMWNGDEDDKKEDEEDGDAENEKEKGPQEDIEAHGAQGQGEAETTAKDEEESKSKKDKDPKNDSKDVEKENIPEQEPQEPQEPDKTDFEDKDAQFDVQMQPQGPAGDAEGEGEGEGQGEGEGEGEEGDSDSDFIKSDIEMEGEGQDDQDEGSEGSKCEEDVGDLDAAEPGVPEEKLPEDAPEQTQGVEPCVQGEDKQPEEQEDKSNAEQKPDVDPSKAQSQDKEEKPAEPLKQGDPGAPSLGKENAQRYSFMTDQFMDCECRTQQLHNSGSRSKMFLEEALVKQQTSNLKLSKMHKMQMLEMNVEMPSAKPQKSAANKKEAPSKPSPAEGDGGEERRLQKLDILKEAEGADQAMGEQQDAGAEQGLHLADPKSGLEALGECQDSAAVDQKAMGITEQDAEGEEEDDPMAVDEEQGKKEQKLPNMHLQEMKEGQLPEDQGCDVVQLCMFFSTKTGDRQSLTSTSRDAGGQHEAGGTTRWHERVQCFCNARRSDGGCNGC